VQNSKAKVCLGIGLSGYQTKETAIVRLTVDKEIASFEILSSHPFNDFNPHRDAIATQIEREIKYLNEAYRSFCHIVIDAPIDLSQMPLGILIDDYSIIDVTHDGDSFRLKQHFKEPWRLRCRPIDQVINGQSPLFSYLGAVTQRARLALSKAHASETYPKLTRKLIEFGPKNAPNFLQGFSDFVGTKKVDVESQTDVITKDEFDAIWCALAGLSTDAVVTSHSEALSNSIYSKLVEPFGVVEWPKSYRVLSKWPDFIRKVRVSRERV
jgi:hypothetical protein